MAAERVKFDVEGACDVRVVIGLFGTPEQYLFDVVRLKSFLQQIGIGEMVPCVRIDSV